jgi:hypothetical protein
MLFLKARERDYNPEGLVCSCHVFRPYPNPATIQARNVGDQTSLIGHA